MRPRSDRRVCPRFDVFGALWAALGVPEPVHLVNVTTSGALIDTAVAVPVESVHSLQLSGGGVAATVVGRVRHTALISGSGGQSRYLIGVEFIAPSKPFLNSLEHVITAARSRSSR